MMEAEHLTIAQAARLKGVSRTTIYTAIANQELTTVELLGRSALKRSDVEQWTPRNRGGHTKGSPRSETTKERISQAQKKRWALRQSQTSSPQPEPEFPQDSAHGST